MHIWIHRQWKSLYLVLIKLSCVSYTSFLFFPVLPDVRGPEGQKSGESGSNLGLISGVTVAGLHSSMPSVKGERHVYGYLFNDVNESECLLMCGCS